MSGDGAGTLTTEQPKRSEEEEGQTSDELVGGASKWFAGAFAVLVAAGAFLGISDGKIDRLLHNHPWLVFLSLLVMVMAIVAGALTPLLLSKGPTNKPAVAALVAAGVAVVVSLALLEVAATQSASDIQRPKIEASIVTSTSGLSLKGVIKANSLKSRDHVLLLVYGRSATDKLSDTQRHVGHQVDSDNPPRRSGDGDYIQLLLGSRAGPDRDGDVDLPFEVPVSPGLYDKVEIHANRVKSKPDVTRSQCNDTDVELGCRTIWLPPAPRRPSVTAEVSGGALTAQATINGIAIDDRVKITVRRLDTKRLGPGLETETITPDLTGKATGKLVVTLPPRVHRICVRAKLIPAGAVEDATAGQAETSGCAGGRYSAVALVTRPR